MTLKLHPKAALLAAAAAVAVASVQAAAPVQPQPIYREGEILVKFRGGASSADARATAARLGLTAKRAGGPRGTQLMAVPAVTTTRSLLPVLRSDPAVELAEPNFRRYPRTVVPDDTLFASQWGLRNTGQAEFVAPFAAGTPGADLNMAEAWDADGDGVADRTGIPSVIVAVIDDAFDVLHPDLAPNVIPGHNFISCQDPDDPSPRTSVGVHGTWVAGAATARGNNGTGVAGTAWNAALLPLKFGFDTASHMEALEYARDHGANVINASFGGPGYSQLESDLIASLAADDILYVSAAGNDDSNIDYAQLNYPTNYDADNIVSVAATGRDDDLTNFSQYGPLSIDVAAPGREVVTTAVGGGYSTSGVAGTSFSSPYVAGIAALLKSHVNPVPGFMEMRARLIESGTAVGGANAPRMTTGGRVDADAALDMAARPSLVPVAVTFVDGANGAPDPAETLDVTFTVRNLWLDATNVAATLAVDDSDVTVDSGQQALGTIASLGTGTATFQVTVAGGIVDHRFLNFTLTLTADGGYTAVRTVGAELGTLTLGGPQAAEAFSGGIYDDFHAWHVDVPDGTGKTLLIRSTTSGADIDLLAKAGTPPRYSISVGINPETQGGFFCTSGTTPTCQDPATAVSARLDGTEEISVVDPPAGTYHIVVVNFEQQATPLSYTLEAEFVDGDVQPDAFGFATASGVSTNTVVTSAPATIAGINQPAPISVVGGSYSVNSTTNFVTTPGTVANGDVIRLQGNTGSSGTVRAQVTVGGVTATWLVNPTGSFGSGPDERNCEFPPPGAPGGGLPPAALATLALAALARRLRKA